MAKSKKNKIGFFAVSTGTLGGAIVMLVLNMLLGDEAPWFVEKLSASVKNIYSISLNVEDVFDRNNPISEIDQNQYYVDSQRNFYLAKPSVSNWTIEVSNPGQYLNGLSSAKVPFFQQSLNIFSEIFRNEEISRDDITTTIISNPNSTNEISFTEKSKIGGYEVALNPFEDLDMVKRSLLGGGALMKIDVDELKTRMDESTNKGRQFLEQMQNEMVSSMNQSIRNLWPEPEKLTDNLTITTIRKAVLERNPLYKMLVRNDRLNIMTVLNYLIYTNNELFTANINHIDINKTNDAILIDGSIPLENVAINNQDVQQAELVKIFLISTKANVIYIVRMNYLYGISGSRSDTRELEKLFTSFRITNA
jgi:hypothetical protein